MKPEDKFQYEIVQRYSDEFPDDFANGCLWEINNDAIGGIKKIMHRMAMGMRPGASDLGHFYNGVFSGIECKVEGKKHDKDRIECQKAWGRNIVANGGNYIMSYDIEEIFCFIYEVRLGSKGIFRSCY